MPFDDEPLLLEEDELALSLDEEDDGLGQLSEHTAFTVLRAWSMVG